MLENRDCKGIRREEKCEVEGEMRKKKRKLLQLHEILGLNMEQHHEFWFVELLQLHRITIELNMKQQEFWFVGCEQQ